MTCSACNRELLPGEQPVYQGYADAPTVCIECFRNDKVMNFWLKKWGYKANGKV
jgi:hypothetical protein